MTDGRSAIAGKYPSAAPIITCILDEGAPTRATSSYDYIGMSQTVITWASELHEGDWVAISNSTSATFSATHGNPVVETPVNGETLVIGRIVSTPKPPEFPPTDASADTLAERLAAGYYRTANVQFYAFNAILKATVMCDGSNACVQGVAGTLKYNITGGSADHTLSFDSAASGGVGAVPLHYVAAGTDGDEYTVLVGITGMLIAATGA